jgi:hypothetical protein
MWAPESCTSHKRGGATVSPAAWPLNMVVEFQ